MAHQFSTSYLQDSIGVFHYYKKLGDRAMAQYPDDALFAALDPQSNSIAIIVKHMAGNMRCAGAVSSPPAARNPTATMTPSLRTPPNHARNSWKCESAAGSMSSTRLLPHRRKPDSNDHYSHRTPLRNASHQPPGRHYSHHIGQIVFLAKHLTVQNTGIWQSLSVPRGQSKAFAADVAAGKKSQG